MEYGCRNDAVDAICGTSRDRINVLPARSVDDAGAAPRTTTPNDPAPGTRLDADASRSGPSDDPVVHTDEPVAHADIGTLYDVYGADLFRYCCRILQDRPCAEEAVQDTFVRAWRKAAQWDGGLGSQRTWLFSIAHNVCIDPIRARNARPLVAGRDPADVPVPVSRRWRRRWTAGWSRRRCGAFA